MKRIRQNEYKFEDELYDLHKDPGERHNLASSPEHLPIVETLSTEIDKFFEKYSSPQWDLWKGGQVKSNSTRPFLWKEVWGSSWEPTY